MICDLSPLVTINHSGTLSLLLDGNVLETWSLSELAGTELEHFEVLIDNPAFQALIDAELGMRWEADGGDFVLLDNWNISAVPEPNSIVVLFIIGMLVAQRRKTKSRVRVIE